VLGGVKSLIKSFFGEENKALGGEPGMELQNHDPSFK